MEEPNTTKTTTTKKKNVPNQSLKCKFFFYIFSTLQHWNTHINIYKLHTVTIVWAYSAGTVLYAHTNFLNYINYFLIFSILSLFSLFCSFFFIILHLSFHYSILILFVAVTTIVRGVGSIPACEALIEKYNMLYRVCCLCVCVNIPLLIEQKAQIHCC